MLNRYWFDDAFSARLRNAGKTPLGNYELRAFEMFQQVEERKVDLADLKKAESEEREYSNIH